MSPPANTLAQYKHINLVFLHPTPSSGASLQWPHAKSVLPLLPLDMEIEGWDDWAVEGSLLGVLPSCEDIFRT
jgi:hypothetical protein